MYFNQQIGETTPMIFGETIYYDSENDEVVEFKNKPIKIDESYNYINKTPIHKFLSWFSFKFLAIPYAFIVFKIFKNIKFHNTKILKKHKKGGYFIYANHSNQFCDGICPALICFPKKPSIIVNSANVSMKYVGKFMKMWGAIPIPNTINATKNFNKAIEETLKNNNPILIYPEAHLWPYYTKIRNFPSVSFRYPIKYNKPVYTFTTVYKKRKNSKKPKIEIYIDGPFYPNKNLPEKIAQTELRNSIYNKLNDRASLSNCEFVKYIKRSEHD